MSKLFDEAGVSLSPSHAVKSGRRYRYYVSRRLITEAGEQADGPRQDRWRVPAREIERLVADASSALLGDRATLTDAARRAGMAACRIAGLLGAAGRWKGDVLDLVERADLHADRIAVTLDLARLSGEAWPTIRHTIPTRVGRRGVEMRLVIDGPANGRAAPRSDPALIKAVVRARKWLDDLVAGRARSLAAIARAEGVSDRRVGHLLPLAFLAPDIVEAILAGTQPDDLTAETLIKRTRLPLGWGEQMALLGFD